MAVSVEQSKNFTIKYQAVEFGPYQYWDVPAVGRDDARSQFSQKFPGIEILDCWENNTPNHFKGR